MTPQIIWYLACVLLSSSIVTLGARTLYVLRAPKKFRDCWTFRNFIKFRNNWISEVFPRLKFRGLEKLFLFLVDWNWLYIVRIKWQNCQKGSKCALCDFTFSHCKAWKHSDTKWFVVRNISISPILKLGYQFNFGTGFNLHQKQLNFSHLFVTYVSSSLLTIRSSPSSL